MTGDDDIRSDRVLRMEGIHNFRDYGGYAVRGGGRLREGMLYRSGEHGGATSADLDSVSRLNLAAICDLRSDKERENSPCRRSADFGGRVLFISDTATLLAPHMMAARGVTGPEAATALMTKAYAQIPYRPAFMAAMGLFFGALAETDGPTLIHCMAGKDRTGIAIALLHRAMGVGQDDLMADYLLTNTAGDPEARIAAGAIQVRASFESDVDDESMRVIMSVRPAFMDHCFATLDKRSGGLDGYLESCGVTPATVEAVKRRLIV